MSLTTQAGAVSGRPLRHRYGPYMAERARTMLPGMMSLKEREKERLFNEQMANERLGLEREQLDLSKDTAQYQAKQAEKAEDIGLIGMGTQLALLNRRNQIQPGMTPTAAATAPSASSTTFIDDPDLTARGADASANESAVDYDSGGGGAGGGGGGYNWQDPAIQGMSGGLIGAGVGRRLSKGKTWGSIAGGAVGGGALAYFGGSGTMMDTVVGSLAGGAVGGLMDLIL